MKKIRPRFFKYKIKVIKLRMLKKIYKLDFEGYYSAKTLNLENEDVTGYEPCYNFKRLLKKCDIKNVDTFLDIGSGKGCALYYAKKFPFKKIDGIEISSYLANVSRENVKLLKDKRMSIYNEDARKFSKYENYNYFYMYNPCKEVACDLILNNVMKSYEKNKRTITIIYQTPKYKKLFINEGFKEIYSNKYESIMRLYLNEEEK